MKPASSLVITVDDRERCPDVVEALRAIEGCCVRTERLTTGDFDIDGRMRIERKTLPDLVASIKDGRLFQQALRLVEAEQWCALILEGTSRDLDGCGMARQAIQGAMVTLTLYLGVPVLRAMDARETARLLITVASQRRRFSREAPGRRGRLPKGKRRLQLHVLQGLPGIGPRRAVRLLDRFGTIDRVVQADVVSLCEVDGIGSSVARTLHWAIHEPAADYAGSSPDLFPPI